MELTLLPLMRPVLLSTAHPLRFPMRSVLVH